MSGSKIARAPPRTAIRDSRDDTLPLSPITSLERFTKTQLSGGFHTPPGGQSVNGDEGSVGSRYSTPVGARFDPGKSSRHIQSYKFKVGDRVEVRDDPYMDWQKGTVHGLLADGRPRIQRDIIPGAPFPFNEVRSLLEVVDEYGEMNGETRKGRRRGSGGLGLMYSAPSFEDDDNGSTEEK